MPQQEFQAWCKHRSIVHLTGAPYLATNGAAELLIQSFKQASRKFSLPPKKACTSDLEEIVTHDGYLQLRPLYGSDQDDDPCEIPTSFLSAETLSAGTDHASSSSSNQRKNPRLPTGDEYWRHNPRRSARTKRLPKKYCC